MDRSISPTVREGSAIPCPQSEPSLTVGLMPRPGQRNLRTSLLDARILFQLFLTMETFPS